MKNIVTKKPRHASVAFSTTREQRLIVPTPFRLLAAWVTVMATLFLSPCLQAAPIHGERMTMTQPDGTAIETIVWGDEFTAHVETPDGYSLTVDPTNEFICYAKMSADGEDLVSTGIPYLGEAKPQALKGKPRKSDQQKLGELGVKKGLIRSKKAVAKDIKKARSQLWPNGGNPWDGDNPVQPAPAGAASGTSSYLAAPTPVSGNTYGLVILVDFPDRPATISTTEVENAFNGANYGGGRGSIKSWVETISNNKASISHTIIGYCRASKDSTYYKGKKTDVYKPAEELRKEVFAWADETFDFSTLTQRSGKPVAVCILYAGDKVSSGWATGLWPHAGSVNYVTKDGVTIGTYFLSNLSNTIPLSLSTPRHELGHSVFKWPDTYDYNSDSKSAGGYARETNIPCSVFRAWHNWIQVIDVNALDRTFVLPENGEICLRYKNPNNAKEYFMVEYLRKTGWNSSAPDQGVLVWHVDENGNNSWQDMTPTKHYALSVEQADGRFDLERNIAAGDGDLFHAGYKTEFNQTTSPNSNWWNGSESGFSLSGIGALGTSTINVTVGATITEPVPAAIISPADGASLEDPSQTVFERNAGTGVEAYELWVGTTFGGQEIYRGPMAETTLQVPNVAWDRTIHARLHSLINGEWQYKDYAYFAYGNGGPIVAGGIYRITPKVNLRLSVEVENEQTNAYAQVIGNPFLGKDSQLWYVASAAKGKYSLVPIHAPALCMDVYGSGATDGTPIIIWPSQETNDQLWEAIDIGGGGYHEIAPAHAPEMRLHYSSPNSGTPLELRARDASDDAQAFRFERQ